MRDPNLHQAGRLQPCTALSGASAGKSKQCNAGSVHSISLRRRDLLTAGGVTLGSTLLLQSPPPAWALEPPPEGSPALKELYADCQKVASVLRTAADLDLEGSDASDADIQVYIKLQALPVLKGYVKNYGDRRGRVVLQAKGYSAVPASDAVIDTFQVLKAVAKPPKPGQPFPRLSAADRALIEEKLVLIESSAAVN